MPGISAVWQEAVPEGLAAISLLSLHTALKMAREEVSKAFFTASVT